MESEKRERRGEEEREKGKEKERKKGRMEGGQKTSHWSESQET